MIYNLIYFMNPRWLKLELLGRARSFPDLLKIVAFHLDILLKFVHIFGC